MGLSSFEMCVCDVLELYERGEIVEDENVVVDCVDWALVVQWCSGYHVRLTRGRSPVRARAEPDTFPLHLTILHY